MPSRFPNCLQMQRGNLERARLLFRKHERFPSPAASAIALVQKEFINESVGPSHSKLHPKHKAI